MKSLAYILVFVYGLFALSPIIPFIEYGINYDFIVAEKCENKDKPEMKCNGKCHLKKKIEETTPEPSAPQQAENFEYYEFVQLTNEELATMLPVDIEECMNCNKLDEPVLLGYKGKVFHPPRC